MNKLRNEIMKIHLDSSYSMGSIGTSLYDELIKKRLDFLKYKKEF